MEEERDPKLMRIEPLLRINRDQIANTYENQRYQPTRNKLIKEYSKLGYNAYTSLPYTIVETGEDELYFSYSLGMFQSLAGVEITNNKRDTVGFLKEAGVSVAEGHAFSIEERDQAKSYAMRMKDAVIKPMYGRKGDGITVGINSEDEFDNAWEKAIATSSKGLLVEKRFDKGIEARFLVVGGKCVAIFGRIPPNIVGDGEKTILELIEEKNVGRRKNPHTKTRPILIDKQREMIIAEQGFFLDDIPSHNERIIIDWKAGISTGADSINITEHVHSSFKNVAVRAVTAIPGLDTGGVDILAENYFVQADPSNHIVIEINKAPVLGGHHYPVYGKIKNAGKILAEYNMKAFNAYKRKINDTVEDTSSGIEISGESHIRSSEFNNLKGSDYPGMTNEELIRCSLFDQGVMFTEIYSHFLIKTENGSRLIKGTTTDNTHYISAQMMGKRYWQRRALKKAGLPITTGAYFRFDQKESARNYSLTLSSPRMFSDLGVENTRVEKEKRFNDQWRIIRRKLKKKSKSQGNLEHNKNILIDDYFTGDKVSFFIVGGKCKAAIKREPLTIEGNGINSIKELIENKNAHRATHPLYRKHPIIIEDDLSKKIRESGYSINTILSKGEGVILRDSVDIMKGGETHDVFNLVHPSLKGTAEKASKILNGLDIVVVDIVTKNISVEANEKNHVFENIVVNPPLAEFSFPLHGNKSDLASIIVDYVCNSRPNRLYEEIDDTDIDVKSNKKVQKDYAIAKYVKNIKYDDIPEIVINRAKLLVLDNIGLIVEARAKRKLSNELLNIVQSVSGFQNLATAETDIKYSSQTAGLVNGYYAQWHDFNDGNRLAHKQGGSIHPGRVIVPAALAVAEQMEMNGKEFLTLVVLGYDIAMKIRGKGSKDLSDYYAAAAIAARAYGGNEDEISRAMGLAGYMAISQKGTFRKGSKLNSFKNGMRVKTGIEAALMALSGVEGPYIINVEKNNARFKTAYKDMNFEVMNVYLKPYPTCRMTHSAIEAAIKLKSEYGFSHNEIERVNIKQLNKGMYTAKKRPEKGLGHKSAQFNLYYCVAQALVSGELTLDQFTKSKLSNPEVFMMADRINVIKELEYMKGYPLKTRTSSVEVLLKDGSELFCKVDLPKGAPENFLSVEEVQEKFLRNTVEALGERSSKELLREVMNLDMTKNINNDIVTKFG